MWTPSPEAAEWLFSWSNIGLILSLVATAATTVGVVWMANVRDGYLKRDLAVSDERIAELGSETAQARAALGEAQGEIARANERAAEAAHRASEADIARLTLEQKLAPRRLSNAAQEILRSSLQDFTGTHVRVESYALDAEGQILAAQIRDALTHVLVVEDWVGGELADATFVKGINVSGDNNQLVDALASSLRQSGLDNISTEPLPPPALNIIVANGSRMKSEEAVAAVVLVGVKPIAQ
jgi:hypothetical protein